MSHTAKLKRKAAEVESNLDESFVTVGTALPALSSTKKDSNEFLPVWQQEVRDEQGRRRLHGAFTGGFSAGYFNTVGSKEGWKPAEFKSSRAEKGKARESRPEDFMDEEDLAELRGAREMATHASFAAGAAASTVNRQSYDPFAHLGTAPQGEGAPPTGAALGARADAAFADLVKPSGGRAGEKIMRQMGWREGQGVGPRVTRKRRAQAARELGLEMDEDEDETEEADKHVYAPIDRPLALFEVRTGLAGLGYSRPSGASHRHPGAPYPGVSQHQGIEVDGTRMPQGASFGLGALNDVEDDDEDPYSTRNFITDPRARRLLEEPQPFARASRGSRAGPSSPPRSSTFADGKPVVRGFRLAGATKDKQPWFAAPEPPRGWAPNPKAMWDRIRKAQMGALDERAPEGQRLNSMERGRILGEEPIRAPPRSVFDFLSAKDKARLEALRASGGKPSAAAPDREPEVPLSVPHIDASVARSALQGFIPFGHDPPKQARYRLYLQAQAHMLPAGTVFSPKPAPGQRMEQVNAELESFAQSAMMFKPMSAAMASRFTSAGSSAAAGEPPAPEPGLRKPVFEPDPTPEQKAARDAEAKRKEEEEREAALGPAARAVRMGMFGRLTRTEAPFYPVRLLCKRFNVPDPHPGGPKVEAGADGAARWGGGGSKADEALVARGYHAPKPDSPPPQLALPENEKGDERSTGWVEAGEGAVHDGPPKPLGQVGLGDDETQGRDTLASKRPPMDLFKAIFADSEDEDEEDPGGDAEGPAGRAPTVAAGGPAPGAPSAPAPSPLPATRGPHRPPPQAAPGPIGPTLGDTVTFSSVPTVVAADSAALLSSFRPTFTRKGTGAGTGAADADPAKAKKAKKGKKRAITSFADEEELAEGEPPLPAAAAAARAKSKKQKPKGDRPAFKKTKRDAPGEEEGEEMVWVEKEQAALPSPPPAAATIAPQTPLTSAPLATFGSVRARPKAADFLD